MLMIFSTVKDDEVMVERVTLILFSPPEDRHLNSHPGETIKKMTQFASCPLKMISL